MNLFSYKEQSSTSPHQDQPQQEMTSKQMIIREIKSLSIILLLLLTFRSICFEPFRIPSGSMIPTLYIGDFILVNKMSYGFKVPFSDFFGDPIYLSTPKMPERGDVIVFKYPMDKSINYIKRVIALPGDTVEVVNDTVYINDTPISFEEISGEQYKKTMDDKYKDHRFLFFKASHGPHEFHFQLDQDIYAAPKISNFPKITVPANKLFVMGDNRHYSADSRFWKFVPFENIKGKAFLVWFSMIFPFSEHAFKFRPWRIGTPIS